MKPLRKATVMFKDALAEMLKIPAKVVAGIFTRFGDSLPMMLAEIMRSRLSAVLSEKVRMVVEARHQRLFGS
jgi:hypothetical protein